jgi:hypothetical protein
MNLFDGFVHPGLLVGMALAAVPLVIHLLNRQRYKPMPWAAMRFVLAAYRKTRRRAQLENLLLLLLRMLGLALLALAISRPFTGDQSPLAALAQSRRDVVLVLDASASTGYRPDVQATFERIVERAREIVLELDGGRDDRVRVIVAGARPRLVAWRRPDEALSVLSTLSAPTDEPLDLAAALGEVVRLAEEDGQGARASALEIRLLTDLQRASFEPATALSNEDGPRAPAVREQLDALAKLEARVLVEDLGPSEAIPPNLAITSIEPLSTVLGAQAPCDVAVSVRNFGAVARNGVRVQLSIDVDTKLPFRPVDVPALGETKAVFPVVFATPGPHVLTARIESDRLATDDARAHVLVVPPPVRVLLVNGEPKPEIENDEVGFLQAVLDPPVDDEVLAGGAARPFEPKVIEPHELRDPALDLASVDVVVLANVDGLPAESIERLERWTAEGGSLILTLGDRVDSATFNQRLSRPDGSGLSPGELGGRIALARRDGYHRVREFALDHPAFALFVDERWRPLFTEVPIYEFRVARPQEGAKVLARLDDEGGSPLLIEKTYDRGRTFLWTTSIDPEWTRLPESPRTLVPLVHEWLRYAGRRAELPRNVGVGGALLAEVDAFRQKVEIVSPEGRRRPLDGEPAAAGALKRRVTALGATERAGVYRIAADGATPEPYAVQLDTRESDLARMEPQALATFHPALVVSSARDSSGEDPDEPAPARGELWRGIAIACFAVLVFESLWAAWLGRSRRVP